MLSRREFVLGANGVVLTFPFLGLIGCDDADDELHHLKGKTMGTSYNVKLVPPSDGLDPDMLTARIDERLQNVDQLMSTYRATSDVSRFGADPAGAPRSLAPATAEVVRVALTIAEMTGGAFDPTIGPLVDLWGFGPGGARPDLPRSGEIAAAMADVDYRKVTLSGETIAKAGAGTRLDLSGIAKGYGVDVVAAVLDAEGVENYLVEVGGEVRTRGAPGQDRAWRLGIEEPTATSRDVYKVVDLTNQALATSGNYRIFFEADGRRYTHIVDPRSGHPVTHALASVTVLAPTTIEADALSTAMLVLGPEDAMTFAEAHDVAAFLIARRNGALVATASPAFDRQLAA